MSKGSKDHIKRGSEKGASFLWATFVIAVSEYLPISNCKKITLFHLALQSVPSIPIPGHFHATGII